MEKWLGKYSGLSLRLDAVSSLGYCSRVTARRSYLGSLGEPKQTGMMMLTAGVIEFVGGIMIAVGLLHELRRVHRKRPDGGSILHAALLRWVLANRESRRACGVVLLRVSCTSPHVVQGS